MSWASGGRGPLTIARRCLSDGAEDAALYRARAQFLIAMVREAEPKWRSGDEKVWLDRIKSVDMGVPRPMHLTDEFNSEMDRARDALGEQRFTAAWNQGKAMSTSEAIRDALRDET